MSSIATAPNIYNQDQNADNEKPVNIITPAPGRIVVWEDKFKYSGSIIIPENAKRKPTIGVILAVGEGCPDWLQEGLRVIFPMYSGTAYYFKGCSRIRILSPEEIHGYVNTEENVELEDSGA